MSDSKKVSEDSRTEPSLVGRGQGPLKVAIYGAAGRMGTCLTELCQSSATAVLGPRIVRPDSPRPEGTCFPEDVKPADFDVLVEFTSQPAIVEVARWVTRWELPWVSGTTGLSKEDQSLLRSAAEAVPVLWAPNMSLGVALLGRAVAEAARLLPEDWQMEIVETHHPAKLDAPSGTALALAEHWRSHRGGELIHGREGRTGPRPRDEIGIHALRLPNTIGEHRVVLGGPDETLEWSHRAHDRGAFVRGALEAASWLVTKKAGLYGLDDWARDRLGNR